MSASTLQNNGTSVRAKSKVKDDKDERKTVFRTALSDPFGIQWPAPSANVRRMMLDELLSMLSDSKMADHRASRKAKRKRAGDNDEPERPSVLNDMSIGINEVTRSLESLVRWTRWQLGLDQQRRVIPLRSDGPQTGRKRRRKSYSALPEALHEAAPALERKDNALAYVITATNGSPRLLPNCPTRKPKAGDDTVSIPNVIFVCKPDINPASLVDHLPGMVALQNASLHALRQRINFDSPALREVYLVPLGAGAEQELAQALALRRVTALSLSAATPNAGRLLALVKQHLKPVEAPWLRALNRELVPTHIKHLQTTQPRNPKAASIARKEAKAAKKEELKKAKKRKQAEAGPSQVYVADDEE